MKIIIYLLFGLILVLAGCGGATDNTNKKESTPEQSVTAVLTALKTMDVEKAQQYIDVEKTLDFEVDEADESAGLIFKNLDFKILDQAVEGDRATVTADITNIDLKTVFGEFLEQSIALVFANAFSEDSKSEEEMDAQTEQLLIDLLKEEGREQVTTTVDIHLVKDEGAWMIEVDEAFQDAITGGLSSAAKEMNESWGSDSEEEQSSEGMLLE